MTPIEGSGSSMTTLPPPPPPEPALSAATVVPARHTHEPRYGGDGASLDNAGVEQLASDILDVGARGPSFTNPFGKDDYDARMDAFAERVSGLDDDSAARVFDEIIEQDPGALNSWLQGDRVQSLSNDDRISTTEMSAVVDAMAMAYTNGRIDFFQASEFIGAYEASFSAPALSQDAFRATDSLLAAGSDSTIEAFRSAFAEDMLRERVIESPFGGVDTMVPAAYAMHLLEKLSPDAAADVVGGFSAGERQTIYEAVAQGGIGYINSRGEMPDLNDPMATLISSVASSTRSDMAVEIAKYAETSNDEMFFDYEDGGYQLPKDQRAEALGELLGAHGDAILDPLTEYDSDLVAGTDSRVQQVGVNALQLGNLMRLTVFNPDAASQDQAMNAVLDYAADQRQLVLEGSGMQRQDAMQSLAVLGAASQDAVNQVYVEADRAAAAREQMVGFVADLALAGLPIDGSKIAGHLGKVFGDSTVTTALEDIGGSLIDSGTEALTDEAKQAIVDALGPNMDDAEAMKQQINGFVDDAVLAGLDGDDAATIIRNSLSALPDRIDEARDR